MIHIVLFQIIDSHFFNLTIESGIDEFILNFRAPLIIRNALPYSLEIKLDNAQDSARDHKIFNEIIGSKEDDRTNDEKSQKSQERSELAYTQSLSSYNDSLRGISAGHHWGFYDFNLEHDLKASMILEESYKTSKPFLLHKKQDATVIHPSISKVRKQSTNFNAKSRESDMQIRDVILHYSPKLKKRNYVQRAVQLKKLEEQLKELKERVKMQKSDDNLEIDTRRLGFDQDTILNRVRESQRTSSHPVSEYESRDDDDDEIESTNRRDDSYETCRTSLRLRDIEYIPDRWKYLLVLYQDKKDQQKAERRETQIKMWQKAKLLALQKLETQRQEFANDLVARRATGYPDEKHSSPPTLQQGGLKMATKPTASIEEKLSHFIYLEANSIKFGDSGAKEVTVFAPVLLVNRTRVTIHVKRYLSRNFLVLNPSIKTRNLDILDVTSEGLPLPVLYSRDIQTQIRAVVDDFENNQTRKRTFTEWSDRMTFSGIGLMQAISLKVSDRKAMLEDTKKPQYDIGIEIVRSPDPFANSLLVIFKDLHIFENLTTFDIEYRQRGSIQKPSVIKAGERKAFHWEDVTKSFSIVIRPIGNLMSTNGNNQYQGEGDDIIEEVDTASANNNEAASIWCWSGAFSLDIEAQTGLRIDHKIGVGEHRIWRTHNDSSIIIPCDVTAAHGYLLTTFLQPGRSAPYRIENHVHDFDIQFRQIYNQQDKTGDLGQHSDNRRDYDNMTPRDQSDAGDSGIGSEWASVSGGSEESDTNLSRFRSIEGHDELKAPRLISVPPKSSVEYGWDEPLQQHKILFYIGDEQREFNLDEIGKTLEPITVKSSANANNKHLSRTLTKSLNLKGKLKKILIDERYRKLYISIDADGPTRVLKVSDEKSAAFVYREKSIMAISTYIKELRDELQEIYNNFPNSEELLFDLLVAKLNDIKYLRELSQSMPKSKDSNVKTENEFVQGILTLDSDREIVETQAALELVRQRINERSSSLHRINTIEYTENSLYLKRAPSIDDNDFQYSLSMTKSHNTHAGESRLGSIDEVDSIFDVDSFDESKSQSLPGTDEYSLLGGNLDIRVGNVTGLKPLSTSAAIKEQEIILLKFSSEKDVVRKVSRLRSVIPDGIQSSSTSTSLDFAYESIASFDTISAASNLNIEMFSISSGGFFGKNIRFLGEIDVPLLPTADKSSKEILVYNFSRRYKVR